MCRPWQALYVVYHNYSSVKPITAPDCALLAPVATVDSEAACASMFLSNVLVSSSPSNCVSTNSNAVGDAALFWLLATLEVINALSTAAWNVLCASDACNPAPTKVSIAVLLACAPDVTAYWFPIFATLSCLFKTDAFISGSITSGISAESSNCIPSPNSVE